MVCVSLDGLKAEKSRIKDHLLCDFELGRFCFPEGKPKVGFGFFREGVASGFPLQVCQCILPMRRWGKEVLRQPHHRVYGTRLMCL